MKRPGSVTFVGVLLILHATFVLVGGLLAISLRVQDRLLDQSNLSRSDLLGAGLGSFISGAVILLVAWGIFSGSRAARLAVTVVEILVVAVSAWQMFWFSTSYFVYQGLASIGIAILVLWSLYNGRADQYYDPESAAEPSPSKASR